MSIIFLQINGLPHTGYDVGLSGPIATRGAPTAMRPQTPSSFTCISGRVGKQHARCTRYIPEST
jgi:hypothetical protein